MARSRPAAGGGHWVEVDPVRLARWLDGFAARHGPPVATPSHAMPGSGGRLPGSASPGRRNPGARQRVPAEVLCLTAPDGATAELFPPAGASAQSSVDGFVTEAARPHRLGLLLARQRAVAVAVADGDRIEVSKVDSSYVQGRTAAGGWSQQRFARRRVNQAKAATLTAADIAVRLLGPEAGRLDALVTGGDGRTVEKILADPRLGALAALRTERLLDVGEPRYAALAPALVRARAVLIRVQDVALTSE